MNKKINNVLKTTILLLLTLSTVTIMAEATTITNLYTKSLGDGWITVMITSDGAFGLDIDETQVWTSSGVSGSQFKIGSGLHNICAYDTANTCNRHRTARN